MSYLFTFHSVHGVLSARTLEWFPIASSSGLRFDRTLHYDPCVLVALGGMAHSSIELRKPLHHNKAMIHEGVTLLDTTQLQFNFPDGFSLSTFYEVVSLL